MTLDMENLMLQLGLQTLGLDGVCCDEHMSTWDSRMMMFS